MSVLTEEIVEVEQELIEEQYVAGEPFDHTIEHSDTYYEEYIENFVPNGVLRTIRNFCEAKTH